MKIKHFVYASSSSVYGDDVVLPIKEKYLKNKPLSFYGATKICNEVIAHSYSNIYKLPCTALRFFTVYGPYGRPDMSLFKFTNNILKNKKIDLFNNGDHFRDFTYIDDIVNGIKLIINKPSKKTIPFEIYNLGKGNSVSLLNYIKEIEKNIGKKAKFNKLPPQDGDVYKTHSDSSKISKFVKEKMKTSIEKGLNQYLDWFDKFYD